MFKTTFFKNHMLIIWNGEQKLKEDTEVYFMFTLALPLSFLCVLLLKTNKMPFLILLLTEVCLLPLAEER